MIEKVLRKDTWSQWKNATDLWSLGILLLLLSFGGMLLLSIAQTTYRRTGVELLHQLAWFPVVAVLLVGGSFLSLLWVRRIGLLGFGASYFLLWLTAFFGTEINGAKRWIYLFGTSVQPSELLKPCFVIAVAWVLAQGRANKYFPGMLLAIALLLAVLFPLATQPDLGQSLLISLAWLVQASSVGIPLLWLMGVLGLLVLGAVSAWFFLPYVASRIAIFLDPATGEGYQVDVSLSLFRSGGLWGKGPGLGEWKHKLPDAHSDFIFAVAGEELGFLLTSLLVLLFAFVCLSSMERLCRSRSLFAILAGIGLVTQFAGQIFINIFSTLALIPPKGMTLPLISHGGSSLLSMGLGLGLLLALTRYHNA